MLHLSAGNAVLCQCCVSNLGDCGKKGSALRAIAERSPGRDSSSQLLEYLLGVLPVDAGVCDRYTVLQTILALLGYLLVAYQLL